MRLAHPPPAERSIPSREHHQLNAGEYCHKYLIVQNSGSPAIVYFGAVEDRRGEKIAIGGVL